MASRQRQHKGKRSFIFLVLSTLIVLIGGTLTLLVQQRENSRADAGYVVGAPTLSAATVDQIFARVGSPMTGTGAAVEQAAQNANIDDAFALAVWWTETNDGAAGVGLADRNPGSVRGTAGYPAAFDGYTIYPSYTAAINDWFTLLRARYVNRGLTSAYSICYSYVGTSSAASWAGKVVNLMLRYHGEAPAPVTSAPVPAAPIAVATPIVQKSAPLVKAPIRKKQVNKPVPMREQHRPVNVGVGQVQNFMLGSGRPARSVPRANSGLGHASGIFTPHVQQILILLVLLAAILVLLPSISLRRRDKEDRGAPDRKEVMAGGRAMRTTEGLRTESLLPLYVNEYSLARRGQEERTTRETGALERDVAEIGVPGVPATPILSGIGTVPLTPFVASMGAGYGDGRRGETALRRARLVPVGADESRKRMEGKHTQGQLGKEEHKTE